MSDINSLSLQRLLENAYIGVVIHRWDTEIVYANSTAIRLLGMGYDSVIGCDAWDPQWYFVDEHGKRLMFEDYPVNRVKRKSHGIRDQVLGLKQAHTEDITWFKVNAYQEGAQETENRFLIVTFNDISYAKNLFSYQDILENTQDIVIVTEAFDISYPLGPKIVYVNEAFEKMTGYSAIEAIGETPRFLQGELTSSESKARINLALKNKKSITETLLNYDKCGRPYWIEMNIIPLKNRFGEVTHFAAIERDVSERKYLIEQLKNKNDDLKSLKRDLLKIVDERSHELQSAKEKLELIAYIDPLTNIPNRRNFLEQSEFLIGVCNRRNLLFAMGIIDLDNFKQINDEYGHNVGDQILIEYSKYLKNLFRAEDVFCRYGGEEFAFSVSLKNEADAELIGQRLTSQDVQLSAQVNTDTQKSITVNYTVSVGMSVMKAVDNIDKDIALKEADNALYEAKENGKNGYLISYSYRDGGAK